MKGWGGLRKELSLNTIFENKRSCIKPKKKGWKLTFLREKGKGPSK